MSCQNPESEPSQNEELQPNVEPQGISKKQQKKQLKKEKLHQLYKAKREAKKQQKKQEKLQKKQQEIEKSQNDQREEQTDLNEQVDQPLVRQVPNRAIDDNVVPKPKKKRKDFYREQMQLGARVVIDLQFLNEMNKTEKTSLYKQIELCHSTNYRCEKPVNLFVTSLQNDFRVMLDKSNASKWGITLEDKHYLDLFDKAELIYLTGDSQEDMVELEKDKVYIIGGLVDHNRLKDITLKKSQEQNLKTLRFPISKYMTLKTSTILTVNQVFEVLLRLQNGEDWKAALEHSIPKRKRDEL